jgi:hypothetical protein
VGVPDHVWFMGLAAMLIVIAFTTQRRLAQR